MWLARLSKERGEITAREPDLGQSSWRRVRRAARGIVAEARGGAFYVSREVFFPEVLGRAAQPRAEIPIR